MLRNRTLLVTLILYPLILVSILGLVFANPKEDVPIAVVVSPAVGEVENDAFGGATFSIADVTDLLDEITTVTLFSPKTPEGFLRAQDDAKHLLITGDVDAVLVFPDNFLTDIGELTTQAHLQVYLDASDLAKATVAENMVRGAIQRFNEDVVRVKVDIVVAELDEALGSRFDSAGQESFHGLLKTLKEVQAHDDLSDDERRLLQEAITFVENVIQALETAGDIVESISLPVQADVAHVTSGSLFTRDVIVPATVALSIFWTGILASSSLTVYERQSHAQVRLNVSPIGTASILASKLLVTVLIILAQSLFIILAAKIAWDVRIDNPGLLVAMVGVGAFAAVGGGLLVAGVSRDTNGSTLLSVLVVFPMMFLSGLFFPISFMPPAAQALARTIPLTYAVEGLRGAMLKRFAFPDAEGDIIFLVAFGLVAFVVGYVLNHRRARGV